MENYGQPSRERRRRRSLLTLLLGATALISATGATMSMALFTSTVSANGNAFTAGTIILGVAPSPIILTSGSLMPGDNVPAGVPGQAVTVSNTGTGQLRYAIAGTSTDADNKHLNTQLLITIAQPDGNAGASCALMTGLVLFSALVPTAGVNMVGNPAQGSQAGDRVLNATSSETLCFKASLPIGTANGYQGAASIYTFNFSAEQTANN
jgi:hypothetical protein